MLRGFLPGMGERPGGKRDLQTTGKGAIIEIKRIECILNKDWLYSKYVSRELVK